jgi:uncharacterized membrane protein YfcA
VHSVGPLYTVAGFFVGLLVSMTGVAGGSLMTPLLILVFGIHPVTAVGTDLLYAAVTKAAGAAVHGLNRTVEWRLVGRLASGSAPASAMTLLVLWRFGLTRPEMQHFISAAFGAALVMTALVLVFRPRIVAWFAGRVGEPPPSPAPSGGLWFGAAPSFTMAAKRPWRPRASWRRISRRS